MKPYLFIAAAGLIFSTGCSKQEEPAAQKAPSNEAVTQPIQIAAPATNPPPTVKEQVVTAVTSIREQAVVAGTETVEKAKTAVRVTSEDVLADLKLSPEEVKTKAAGCDQSQLTAYADGYRQVLSEKKQELASLSEKLKGLQVTDMLGEKGKSLKTQISEYTSQLSGLKERYGIYLDLLKKFGVDLSAYGL